MIVLNFGIRQISLSVCNHKYTVCEVLSHFLNHMHVIHSYMSLQEDVSVCIFSIDSSILISLNRYLCSCEQKQAFGIKQAGIRNQHRRYTTSKKKIHSTTWSAYNLYIPYSMACMYSTVIKVCISTEKFMLSSVVMLKSLITAHTPHDAIRIRNAHHECHIEVQLNSFSNETRWLIPRWTHFSAHLPLRLRKEFAPE